MPPPNPAPLICPTCGDLTDPHPNHGNLCLSGCKDGIRADRQPQAEIDLNRILYHLDRAQELTEAFAAAHPRKCDCEWCKNDKRYEYAGELVTNAKGMAWLLSSMIEVADGFGIVRTPERNGFESTPYGAPKRTPRKNPKKGKS